MFCHTIRKKIFSPDGLVDKALLDQGVKDHLKQCPGCASLVRAEETLGRDFETIRSSKPSTELPLTALRENLKARITIDNASPSLLTDLLRNGGRLMNLATKNISNRPKLSLSFGVLLVILLVAITVPLNIGRELQYQVALAAVSQDLALNADALRQLLTSLDIEDANVDVNDCEPRCRVQVSNLKNLDEVQIVVAAVDLVGNLVVEDVSESSRPAKSTLLQLAGENLFIEGDGTKLMEGIKADVDTRTEEFDLLMEDGRLSLWSLKEGSDGSAEELEKIMTLDRKDGRAVITLTDNFEVSNEELLANSSMPLIDPYGNEHVFYFDNPEHRALLAEMGFDFENLGWKNGAPEWPEEIIHDGDEVSADESRQLGNYPNPFNPSTVIAFSLEQAGPVDLSVYNIQGQKIRRLLSETLTAGEHSVEWDGRNDSGNRVASGVYFYQLRTETDVASHKMILLK